MPAAWGNITAGEILSPTNANLVSGNSETALSGISTDSRSIRPGELFWALKGERFDGHDFALKAIEQRAAGIMVQKEWWNSEVAPKRLSNSRIPLIITVNDTLKALGDLAAWWRQQHNVRVVAITGSSGKTTTKEMVANILEQGSRTLKNKGNLNNLIGLPLTLLQLEEHHQNAVLEMGMNRPGEIARLTEIADPDVGVITNVGMAHIEGLRDIKGVARAKTELIEKVSLKSKVVLNGDDQLLLKTASRFGKQYITFGLGKKNDVRAGRIRDLGIQGVAFDLSYQEVYRPVKLEVPGLQNVLNALAAAAVSLSIDTSFKHIVKGLGDFAGLKGRFMVTSLPNGITLVDDTYNANPSSLKAALTSIGSMVDEERKIIVCLGEMMELGDATVSEHRQAGRRVAELGTYYFLAMGEHAHEMINGAIESGMPRNRAEVVISHDEMVKKIKDEMHERDLIFVKGSRKMGLEKVVEGLE
ncbi:MAG: UDP-N-acetylmuramoyl-tripeptide--D-alanyl-D-alanine ligase [Deltaproteobacteria bacterium]|nr:UDP-N-acetylmuramoyl-tripeptide--D-alanyl-D-alanine ligase [Deltaproteobacteria bacterium]MBW2117654.1 UDP-N-acetylmuramoyl-tripeptide--D-alanyl-D-alanine ligase [Deltaproteobacteria bacterium]MBW2344347.1 UDP-N-acetylmuramoyl-tripeptide--D-alanyl-D-alanine ligase [Deltaproteobacteria bacterium]